MLEEFEWDRDLESSVRH